MLSNEEYKEYPPIVELRQKVGFLMEKEEFWMFDNTFHQMRSFSWANNYHTYNVEHKFESQIETMEKNAKNRKSLLNRFNSKKITTEVQELIDLSNEQELNIKDEINKSKSILKKINKEIGKNRKSGKDYINFKKDVEKKFIDLFDSYEKAIVSNYKMNSAMEKLSQHLNDFESKSIMEILKEKITKPKKNIKIKNGK